MEAATDTTNAPEAASTSKDARAQEPDRQEAGTILLAATPIGDVRDASPRVVAALEGADIVAAEDTRRALALASRLGIKLGGRLVALHDHNEAEKAAGIVEAAREGARRLRVRRGYAHGLRPRLPAGSCRHRRGRSSVRFRPALPRRSWPWPCPPAFPPTASPSRDSCRARTGMPRATCRTSNRPAYVIFFESPRRAAATLTRMAEVFGADRAAALCRELTKDYEEVRRGTLGQLAEGADDVLGEVTIVVAGYARSARAEDHVGAVLALAAEGMRLKDAAAEVAAAMTGARKNDLYKAALAAR